MRIPKGPTIAKARELIKNDPQQGWVDLVLQYGNSHMAQTGLATCDPDIVNTLLMDRIHTQERSGIYKFTSRLVPGSPGVLFMDGDSWKKHVAAVMPVFTKANIEAYGKCIHETVTDFMKERVDGEKIDDLYVFLTQLGLRVVLKVGYGLDPDEPIAAEYGKELMDYKLSTMTSKYRIDEIALSAKQLLMLPSLLIFFGRLRKMMYRQERLVGTIIASRNNKAQENVDWINLLSKAGMPLTTVTNELNHIYGAFNAIDYTITCAFYELARHPEWVQVLREEFENVLQEKQYPDREDIMRLRNVTNFMKEVYRYYPVAIGVMRQTGKPLEVNGTWYPANKEVMILVQSLHHHPAFWKAPKVFNPNRWNEPMVEPKAFIPFLIGPRQCIGKHLAELHFIITLHALLKNWDILVEDKNIPIVPFIIPRFAKPMPAVIKKT